MLVLLEYLHADADVFEKADADLRAEGRAMLQAVANDLKSAGVSASVALCQRAEDEISSALPVIHVSERSPRAIAAEVAAMPNVTAVFPIAPECDRILLELVDALRVFGVPTHAAPTDRIERFSDKLRTFEFLQHRGIPTVQTSPASRIAIATFDENALAIVKPRNGLSCDGVRRCTKSQLESLLASQVISAETHVLQPFVDGVSYSVGCLGNGVDVTLLPVVKQRIEWSAECPRYLGGTIGLEHGSDVSEIMKIPAQVVDHLGEFTGYIGIDLIQLAGNRPLVMEINPRLCTSYVGYRQLAETNLMKWMLGFEDSLVWQRRSLEF